MKNKEYVELSKTLSWALRHKPEGLGIQLSEDGWTNTQILIQQMNAYGKSIDLETLITIVETNDKKRFAFNADQSMIRANQGHSVGVDLGYVKKNPPVILYHGTAQKNQSSILRTGLVKKARHHVHLSTTLETALQVGQRHGKPMVFKVRAKDMAENGYDFFESDNGVWLTDAVPVEYLSV